MCNLCSTMYCGGNAHAHFGRFVDPAALNSDCYSTTVYAAKLSA